MDFSGLLGGALSGGGAALQENAHQMMRKQDEMDLVRMRADLEEQKALNIARAQDQINKGNKLWEAQTLAPAQLEAEKAKKRALQEIEDDPAHTEAVARAAGEKERAVEGSKNHVLYPGAQVRDSNGNLVAENTNPTGAQIKAGGGYDRANEQVADAIEKMRSKMFDKPIVDPQTGQADVENTRLAADLATAYATATKGAMPMSEARLRAESLINSLIANPDKAKREAGLAEIRRKLYGNQEQRSPDAAAGKTGVPPGKTEPQGRGLLDYAMDGLLSAAVPGLADE